MSAKTFEQLVIWKRSMDLVETIYRTTRRFPSEERSGLTATLRRTAGAIPAKIADGHGRSDPQAYRKAVSDSLASLRELQTHLIISRRLRYASIFRTFSLRRRINRLGEMLDELMASLDEPRTPAQPEPEPKPDHTDHPLKQAA